jgi:17beta-estradiol 17-dehydrogenase / very-long-chain 3-oxoacyl-CoA reductase
MIPILKKGSQSRSLILNISSAARFGNPYISLYSASKAYVTSLSHTIARECKAFSIPIDCLLIVAGEVRTPGNRAGYAKGTPSAAEYAKIALERVDKAIALGMLEIAPFWTHAIQLAVASVVPESILSSTAVKMAEGKRDAFAKMQ